MLFFAKQNQKKFIPWRDRGGRGGACGGGACGGGACGGAFGTIGVFM